jgi:hypothetical protein
MKNVVLATMVLMNNIFNPGHKLYTRHSRMKRKGMALIKLGGGVADIRGSIGGTVFSKNRYGSYTRNRTIPVNPGTTAQTKIRAAMGQIRNAWFNTLTQAQRNAWAVYASNVSVTNRLGESITLTGWNMFSRTNSNLLYNDYDIVADAPTEFSLAEQDSTLAITISAATQNISVAFDDTMEWVDEDGAALMLYVSRPQNPTVNYFKGPYLIAGKIEGDGTTAPTTPATIALPFAAVAGQKIFAQARIVRADGRLSEPFRVNGTVGA